jgi:hypothetical protein
MSSEKNIPTNSTTQNYALYFTKASSKEEVEHAVSDLNEAYVQALHGGEKCDSFKVLVDFESHQQLQRAFRQKGPNPLKPTIQEEESGRYTTIRLTPFYVDYEKDTDFSTIICTLPPSFTKEDEQRVVNTLTGEVGHFFDLTNHAVSFRVHDEKQREDGTTNKKRVLVIIKVPTEAVKGDVDACVNWLNNLQIKELNCYLHCHYGRVQKNRPKARPKKETSSSTEETTPKVFRVVKGKPTTSSSSTVAPKAYVSRPVPDFVPNQDPQPSTSVYTQQLASSYTPQTQPSSSYVPQTQPSYVPQTQPSYVPQPSSSYVPQPSSSYVPQPSSSYVPQPSSYTQ